VLDYRAGVRRSSTGTSLAGGRWDRIEPIIIRTLRTRDIPTTGYDF
jgi:hypothetical protein